MMRDIATKFALVLQPALGARQIHDRAKQALFSNTRRFETARSCAEKHDSARLSQGPDKKHVGGDAGAGAQINVLVNRLKRLINNVTDLRHLLILNKINPRRISR